MLPFNGGVSGTNAAMNLRTIMAQPNLTAAERIALASVQILQPATQELLRLVLSVNEMWTTNNISAALEDAANAGELIAGYDPVALGLMAEAFNAIVESIDVPLGEGKPTPRQVIMTVIRQESA